MKDKSIAVATYLPHTTATQLETSALQEQMNHDPLPYLPAGDPDNACTCNGMFLRPSHASGTITSEVDHCPATG